MWVSIPTAEILNKSGKICSGKTDSKRRKKGWILDKLSTFPPSKYHLFLYNLKLTENWQEQYKDLTDRLDPDSWITGILPVFFLVIPPPCLLPPFPPCFPAFGGLLETFCSFTPKYFSVSFLREMIFSYDRTVIKIRNIVIIFSITKAVVHIPTCQWIQQCSLWVFIPHPGSDLGPRTAFVFRFFAVLLCSSSATFT